MYKAFALSFILILMLSSAIIAEVFASIPQPAIPEFTVKLIDSSYDIPSTTTVDPYTGKIVTHEGSHVESRRILIKITNEPFMPFLVQEGSANWTANYYYNIRWKGHFEQEWHEIYSPSNDFLPRAVGSETVFSNEGDFSTDGLKLSTQGMYVTFPVESQIDFQVEAMIGYVHRVVEGGMAPWHFFGEKSGWSGTQTLTITETAPTLEPIPSPSSTPQDITPIPSGTNAPTSILFGLNLVEVILAVLLGAVVVLLVFVVVFYLRKRR